MNLATFAAGSSDAQILHVTNAWPHEADPHYGIFVQRQVESLTEIGTSGDVLFIRGFESPVAYPESAYVLVQLRRSRPHKYRLVHSHGGEVAPWAAAFRGVPLIASYLGSDLLGQRDSHGSVSRRQRLRARLVRQGSRLATNTITVSGELETCLPRLVRKSNYVIPDGVDRRLFVPTPRHDARRDLSWDPDTPIILFAAKAGARVKRFWLAEAAWQEARKAIPGLRLQVASDVSPAEMPKMMNAADCLLVTSSSEGSSNVIKEAMSCNLPVVSTDVGDVSGILGEVEPSFVCQPNPQALARAIIACVNAGKRSNGRLYSAGFDALAVARRIKAVYDHALEVQRQARMA